MFQSCIIVAILLVVTCYTNAAEVSPGSTEEARARLDQGCIYFTNNLLNETILSNPDENVVASGVSVFIPVALLALYSKDEVQAQLFKLLNLNNKDEIKAVFSELLKEYNNQVDVTLEVVNNIYANEGYPLSESFKSDSQEYFIAEAENIDFSNNYEAAETINAYVRNRTEDRIENIISPNALNEDSILVLVDAINFLGNWIYPFDRENTQTKDFTNSNGDIVEVEMMYQQNSFNYIENDLFQALQLPYKGNSFSFLCILPISDDGSLILDYFKDPATFTNLLDSMTPKNVQAYVPKFQISFDIDVAEILITQNVRAMFDPNNDGFDGITQESQPIFVSGFFQKTFIQVDEDGTEATGATATMVGTTSAEPTPEETYVFDASHPFTFYILLNNVPLFCGAFVQAQ